MSARQILSVRLTVDRLEHRLVPASAALTQAGILRIVGDDTSETIRLSQSAGRITVHGANIAYNAAAVREVQVDARGGHDLVDLRGLQVITAVDGGAGNDTLMGGEKGDALAGGTGYDRLFGLGGGDALRGDGHDDRLFGGAGYDSLYGGTGIDFMDDGSRTAHEFYADEADGAVDYIADMVAPATGAAAAHVRQGSHALTCYFLATVAGMAQAGVDMRTYIDYVGYDADGVGLYDVKLYNGRQWTRTRVLFEGHTAATDAQPTADYASWAIILHRAWGQFYGNRGGLPEVAMRAFGRTTAVTTSLGADGFNTIATALSRRQVVVSGTVAQPMGALEGNHAYTIVEAQVSGGTRWVRVRNPWGYDGGTGGDNTPGDALIWLTWDQFTRNMRYVAIGA